MTLCNKQETYSKKEISKGEAYSFDYTGSEVLLGSTLKIKSGENLLKIHANPSPYFDVPNVPQLLEFKDNIEL
jgi:hypothetical protein